MKVICLAIEKMTERQVNGPPLPEYDREALGRFCKDSCDARCCRKGQVLASPALKAARLTKDGEHLWLDLRGGCEFLDKNLCSIYDNPARPPICAEYPVFYRYRTIIISSDCTATAEGFFTDFIERAKTLGYAIRIQ